MLTYIPLEMGKYYFVHTKPTGYRVSRDNQMYEKHIVLNSNFN